MWEGGSLRAWPTPTPGSRGGVLPARGTEFATLWSHRGSGSQARPPGAHGLLASARPLPWAPGAATAAERRTDPSVSLREMGLARTHLPGPPP